MCGKKGFLAALLMGAICLLAASGCAQSGVYTGEAVSDFSLLLPSANVQAAVDQEGQVVEVVDAAAVQPPLSEELPPASLQPETVQKQAAAATSAAKPASKQAESKSTATKPAASKPAASKPAVPTEADGPVVLTIKGGGVSGTTTWSLAQLQSLSGGYCEKIYSTVSNWPTKKFFVGKGIDVGYLLKQAGISGSAAAITVQASDGYYAKFTRDQLLGTSYYYPNLKSGSTSGASAVPAMVAWAAKEGTSDLSAAKAGDLHLLVGQKSLNCVNTVASVQKVSVIEVSTAAPGSWAAPTAAESTAADGSKQVTLSHPQLDQVTIYYTLDGSTPDYSSHIYNPSTTYYQPELIKPIPVSGGTVLKTLVFGFGKNGSAVATFQY